MDDLEARLRAAVRQRADELAPASDLPDRIRARVAERRRQHRVVAGALTTAALVLVVVGLAALLTRPADDGSVEVRDDRTTTTPPDSPRRSTSTTERTTSTTTAPPTSQTTGTTAPTGDDDDGAATPTDPPPSPGPGGTTSTTTTTAPPPDLKPPDSEQPVAGTCGPAGGAVVELVIFPDVPSPRCAQVTADQRLQVRNDTDQTVTVTFADFTAELAPGETAGYDRPFGDYLQPGVHRVGVSYYGGSGPEIWLQP